LPGLRYSSNLIGRLPASTVVYAAIPNLGDYLASAESVLHQKVQEQPALSGLLERNSQTLAVIDKLRAGSAYLGDELVLTVQHQSSGEREPVFFAEVKREGFAEFLKQAGIPLPLESRNGFVVFGPDASAVAAMAPVMDSHNGGFESTAFYQRIKQAYHEGAGLLLCVDLTAHGVTLPMEGARYLVAEQKEVDHKMEARATVAFDKERTGMAAWLAAPAPMGSLDYITPDASFAAAFVTRKPDAIVDHVSGLLRHFMGNTAPDVPGLRDDLASS